MHQYLIRLSTWLLYVCAFAGTLSAQVVTNSDGFSKISLQNLDLFASPASNWKIAGVASADLEKDEVLNTTSGTGVLVNLPDAKNRGNLTFKLEHGDMDLELEFMMARHSNSGIYLQGRYEVQLFDSWGVKNPSYSDCGGIYERWDDNKPEGQKGYQGYAPRVNAARAPGLWQNLHIAFQAPRFDATGHKIANARIIRIELNGTVLHENLELTGPTRGPISQMESARGPLFIQGDHGPVAFRNIRYRLYDSAPARLENLQYAAYQGAFEEIPDLSKLEPVAAGKTSVLTQEVGHMNEKMLLRFTGTFKAMTAGLYHFQLTAFGSGMLRIDGKTLIPFGYWDQKGQAKLPAGDLPIEIIYVKKDNWYPNGLALIVDGPGFRPVPLQALSSLAPADPDRPIGTTLGTETVMLRSFMDYSDTDTGKTHRIVRAVSVGFPEKTCYTYNMGNGALIQAWKGGFLDATPMWHSRGDGNALPQGTVLRLGDAPFLFLPVQPDSPAPDTLTEAAAFRIMGYDLDDARIPTFHYQSWGTTVNDRITVEKDGNMLTRNLLFDGGTKSGLLCRLASGAAIQAISGNRYLVDGYYYLQVNSSGNKPILRNVAGGQELVASVSSGTSLSYSIIW